MVILGLDPGIAATGYGVVAARGTRLFAVAHGVIRTSAREPHAERLAAIHRCVAAIAEEHGVECAAVEEVYVGPDARGTMLLGQARGAALAALGAAGLDVGEYAVATIKSAVCGYGRAEKQQVARMVRAILSLDAEPPNEHVADALAAAICHAHQLPIGSRR